MKLITKALEQKIPKLYSTEGQGMEAVAYIKLFSPDSSWTWYLTEYSAEDHLGFGWCDNGQGGGELGYVSLTELEQVRGPLGLPIERDLYFTPKPLEQILED